MYRTQHPIPRQLAGLQGARLLHEARGHGLPHQYAQEIIESSWHFPLLIARLGAWYKTVEFRAADTLKPVIDAIINSNRSCEIDATRVEKGEDVETNLTVLEAYINYVLDSIFSIVD